MKHIVCLLFALAMASTSMAFEPDDTGAWYDPEQDGTGFYVATSEPGWSAAWFTYTPEGEQAWFVTGLVPYGESAPLYFPMGFFPAHYVDVGEPVGNMTLIPTASGYRVRYQIAMWNNNCLFAPGQLIPPRPGPSPRVCTGEFALVQLQ